MEYYDIHNKFHKDWFRHSQVKGTGEFTDRHTERMRIPQDYLYFFKIRKVR
jgi:hypothetical protein